jgi:fumarylpyruvate hydrolase
MVSYAVSPPPQAHLDITGSDEKFPVRRIYCIGKNYVAHIREMNADERDPPVIFQKPVDAIVKNGGEIPYPVFTNNFHYECELVVALKSGGYNISEADASKHIFGYAVGLDMTRRDLQGEAKKAGRPWEVGKAFDHAAPCSAIQRASEIGHPSKGEIALEVNGTTRQRGDLGEMIWSVPEIIAHLSGLFELKAGDLIYTGTPAGVGPVQRGDLLKGSIAGVGTLSVSVA